MMVGEALGTFTLVGEQIEGGSTVASTTFLNIPVATGTVVTLLQPAGILSSSLMIDFDGDGFTDLQIGEAGFRETDVVLLLRVMVENLDLGMWKISEFFR